LNLFNTFDLVIHYWGSYIPIEGGISIESFQDIMDLYNQSTSLPLWFWGRIGNLCTI